MGLKRIISEQRFGHISDDSMRCGMKFCGQVGHVSTASWHNYSPQLSVYAAFWPFFGKFGMFDLPMGFPTYTWPGRNRKHCLHSVLYRLLQNLEVQRPSIQIGCPPQLLVLLKSEGYGTKNTIRQVGGERPLQTCLIGLKFNFLSDKLAGPRPFYFEPYCECCHIASHLICEL